MIRPPINGRRWTENEDLELRKLCAQRLSQRRIGHLMGRRASSVGCRMRVLGIPANERKRQLEPQRLPEWPNWIRYEDDPRACRREDPWTDLPVAARSPHGCATALCEMEA